MSFVRTVLGDVAPSALGVVDYHEHLFQVSPLLLGDELEDEVASAAEAWSLHAAGVGTMIEATPTGLGRNPDAIRRISSTTGMHIVHVTGSHHAGHYAFDSAFADLSADALADRFTEDVLSGFAESVPCGPAVGRVRAGMVKAAARYWSIGKFEHRGLEAAAATAGRTGCPLMVHLDFGSAAHEVLDILGSSGVAADRVVLAHADRNPDAGLHISLAERGAYLGYDGMARHRDGPDSSIIALLEAMESAGRIEHVVLGGDVARSSRYVSYGGMPGLAYLPLRFVPRLRGRLDEQSIRLVTGANAARLLTFCDPGQPHHEMRPR